MGSIGDDSKAPSNVSTCEMHNIAHGWRPRVQFGSNAYYTLLAYTTWEEEKEAIQVKLTHLFPNLKNNWDLKK